MHLQNAHHLPPWTGKVGSLDQRLDFMSFRRPDLLKLFYCSANLICEFVACPSGMVVCLMEGIEQPECWSEGPPYIAPRLPR